MIKKSVFSKNYYIDPVAIADISADICMVMSNADGVIREASGVINGILSLAASVPAKARCGALSDACATALSGIRNIDFLTYGQRAGACMSELCDYSDYANKSLVNDMQLNRERLQGIIAGGHSLSMLLKYTKTSDGNKMLPARIGQGVKSTDDDKDKDKKAHNYKECLKKLNIKCMQHNEEEDIKNIKYPEEYKTAQLAGLRTNGFGLPIINSATEAQAFMNVRELLRRSELMGLPEEVDGYTKRYEDFRMLTDTTSNQYQLQQLAFTDEYGFRRIHVEGLDQPAYMVAMGSYYTEADSSGVVFTVTLENGNTFYCVAGDMKDDRHTNSETHQYTCLPEYGINEKNADILEFIMDVENPYAQELLPVSQGGQGYGILNLSDNYSDMNSPVAEIRKLDISSVLTED